MEAKHLQNILNNPRIVLDFDYWITQKQELIPSWLLIDSVKRSND